MNWTNNLDDIKKEEMSYDTLEALRAIAEQLEKLVELEQKKEYNNRPH